MQPLQRLHELQPLLQPQPLPERLLPLQPQPFEDREFPQPQPQPLLQPQPFELLKPFPPLQPLHQLNQLSSSLLLQPQPERPLLLLQPQPFLRQPQLLHELPLKRFKSPQRQKLQVLHIRISYPFSFCAGKGFPPYLYTP